MPGAPPAPPTASAAAKTSVGRSRFPVERRLYRMAAGRGAGHQSPARAPHASRATSTRARASARYASRPRLGVEVLDLEIARPIGEHLLDLRLGGGQPLAGFPQPLHALLEQLERFL